MKRRLQGLVLCVMTTGCQVEPDDTGELDSELSRTPRLVTPGAGVALFAVTRDNHAIYQLGQQVFAAALDCEDSPELIAEVPAGNTAFVYPAGRVAFVWTNPDRTQPGFGVSPLVIWSAEGGTQLASTASAIGTLATAASEDGEHVLFTTNSPLDGTTGDLVLASADLAERTTIATGIPMGFPNGPCVPRAGFLDDQLVVAACAPNSTTAASLAVWRHGVRRELVPAIATPPSLWLDPERGRSVTLAAGTQHPIVADRHGRVSVVAETPAVNAVFGGDGAVLYLGQPDQAGLVPVFRNAKPAPIANLAGIYTFGFGSTGFSQPATSPDGRSLLYFDAVDPTVGVGANVILGDTRGQRAPVTLDSNVAVGTFGVPYSRDSDYVLWARFDTTNFAVGPMFSAGPRGTRQYSDEAGWQWDAAFGSTITFNDNTTLDFTNFALSTADLKYVDLARPTLAPRLIAEHANVTYFGSHRGHGVVFTQDQGTAPGLYVARVGR